MIIPLCALCQSQCRRFAILCDDCEAFSHSGLEESSFVTSALMSFRYPADMSDPWSKVEA